MGIGKRDAVQVCALRTRSWLQTPDSPTECQSAMESGEVTLELVTTSTMLQGRGENQHEQQGTTVRQPPAMQSQCKRGRKPQAMAKEQQAAGRAAVHTQQQCKPATKHAASSTDTTRPAAPSTKAHRPSDDDDVVDGQRDPLALWTRAKRGTTKSRQVSQRREQRMSQATAARVG